MDCDEESSRPAHAIAPTMPAPLPMWQARQVNAVRERMDAARCVFDFTVRQMPVGRSVGEAQHRAVLSCLFDEVDALYEQRHREFLASHPEHADSPAWQPNHDVAQARPSPWPWGDAGDARAFRPGQRVHFSRNPAHVNPFEWLFQAFDDPPYKADCPPDLFADFCDVVGLLPGKGVQVFDWVGDPDQEPHRSTWSPYFEAGKEWWGIWCLTIWNPRRRTLAALAASTTD